jgi:hypothetical protein
MSYPNIVNICPVSFHNQAVHPHYPEHIIDPRQRRKRDGWSIIDRPVKQRGMERNKRRRQAGSSFVISR